MIVLIKFIKVFPHARAKQTYGLLIVASLFFGLSTGLAFIPIDWLPRFWVLLAIGLDLEILAYGIAFLDAFEEGESLKGDILRSFQAAFFSALLFGGQVALVIYLGAGLNIAMIALLLGTITAAISLVTLAAPLQTQLDRLVFFRSAQMQTDRADLRAAARSLGRANLDIDPTGLDDRDFTRYTRRALSHFGDLPRLASNPLTRLPLVDERLQAKSTRLDTLNRAAELKLMLTESIQRLKPNTPDDFGTSDEWRFYNALYFPYVIGLKPYRRVSSHSSLDPLSEQVLEWFQLEVPERTLHNWQNAAAGLIAQDLREQLKDE